MEKIESEKKLLKLLFTDMKSCKKEKVVFLGGHFPLMYDINEAFEGLEYWGIFSKYTLELACKVARFASDHGKEINFVFFVDDHLRESMSGLTPRQLSTRRNNFYKTRSGNTAKLPVSYSNILGKYNFSENDVTRHDHGKKGREDCLYFSEKVLRSSDRAIENSCAREYVTFLEDERYFSIDSCYMVAFIPQRCRENICHYAIDREVNGLSGSHVFLESMTAETNAKQLYSTTRGVLYRKD